MFKKQWLLVLIAFAIIALLGILFPFSFQTGDTSGIDSGAVVGLVAITPAAGFVNVGSSIFIGGFAAIASNLMIYFFSRRGVDDTLDVFPACGIGGMGLDMSQHDETLFYENDEEVNLRQEKLKNYPPDFYPGKFRRVSRS